MKARQGQRFLPAFVLIIATVRVVTSQSCDNNAECVETNAGFSCTCNSGYEGTSTGCVNIDECATSTPCRSGEDCTDNDGGYVCHCGDISNICVSDAQCVAVTSGGTKTCQCQTGYNGDGVTCTDIDECAVSGSCDTNANCTNTPGSFICTCRSGYTGDGVACTDVDECLSGQHSCDSPLTCSNTNGSFECTCGSDASCHANAQCVATGGISSCVCNVGYMGSGANCIDVNECALASANDCDVNADCTNTVGNYTCTCKQTYSGNGKKCEPDGGCIVTISWAALFLVILNVLKNK